MIYEYQCIGCKQHFHYDANYDGFSCAACGKKLIRKDRPSVLGLKLTTKVSTMKKALFGFIKNISFVISMMMLTGCGIMPQVLGEAEHIIDDTCISIKVSQEALRKDTNIKAVVEVENSKYDIKE